ncbi:antibiotic biosynthesis monooxygenase [Pedobacter sp. MC2016-14]|uniref:antibiotic biosynthesis monooxygenase n=1 Tax=Pedobacter sp. MC2016-14 TaxID=2897327 RepID=UPI001E55DE76|nr:antibiotic biosynthesis monooxygenase [Pedobacter sp. MC2016-14]MCD0490600.1 antibiotic biosynthesis monooxygenase [Pedobacter sp. MC2016-14]
MAIHVAITRKILPGKEQEFKESLRNFLGQSFIHDGVHGAAIISSFPGADSNEIGILRTFKDEKERDVFYNSEQFRQWENYASNLTEAAVYRQLTGLEAWFRSSTPPPRWKMAIATLCGVFPTSIFLYYTTGRFLIHLPVPFRLLVTATLMVGILTWVVMPFVTKILKPWLTSK